jgi:hypothetical protein
MFPYLRRHIGEVQTGIGLLHTGLGLVVFRRHWAAIIRHGRVSEDRAQVEQYAAFWFVMTGLSTVAAGQVTRWAQRRTGTVPASLGWSSLAIGLGGGALMPKSGFWFVAAQGLLALAAARHPERPGA